MFHLTVHCQEKELNLKFTEFQIRGDSHDNSMKCSYFSKNKCCDPPSVELSFNSNEGSQDVFMHYCGKLTLNCLYSPFWSTAEKLMKLYTTTLTSSNATPMSHFQLITGETVGTTDNLSSLFETFATILT